MFIFSTHNEHFRVARWPVTGGRVAAYCYHQLAGWPPGHRPPVLRPVGSEIVPSTHPRAAEAQEVPKGPGRSRVSGGVRAVLDPVAFSRQDRGTVARYLSAPTWATCLQ